ncbi:phenazine-specific anthranilate synthase component I [Streptomyces sulphureus]|uniref:phenazine-specific anthranilate synthase component I n=1 Tax=Streptomyces sulphureus TaxID=47758 RepID=UPI0003711774|nr:phenazine-specific anthranilate synthase component I [Streptomyces sulphureus]
MHHARPHSEPAETTAALLTRLCAPDAPPFALLRRRGPGAPDGVEVLTGPVVPYERLAELPESPHGTLALVPFRQITERGFTARDDGTPLAALVAEEHGLLPYEEVRAALPDRPVRVEDGGFETGDAAYEEIVRRVVADEIGAGEGANFVLRRTFSAAVPGFSRRDALALFRRLLEGERGAYWTFVVHTGERVLVGASPEVHVRMSGGTVVMNPISGTYRYPPQGPDVEGLLTFLEDRKEREELSMVVDEELKMMCTVGDRGGVVVGPRLKEMAHLAHTEYELRGRTTLDARDVLRETMFAATVTGSPVENACRVIERYEPDGEGRGYYSGALALLGRDASGAQTLDSPILIRTAEVDLAGGRLRLSVGATLVRASDPAGEVAETHAKAAAVLTALGVREAPPAEEFERPRLGDDPRVRAALESRRAGLSPFWLRMRTAGVGGTYGGEAGAGAHASSGAATGVLVVDAEDTFTSMLAHLLRASGRTVEVRRHDAEGTVAAALAHPGPVVLGPGPGNPLDVRDPRIARLRGLAAELVGGHPYGVLGVCLGHELLAAELGLELVRRERPHQGAQGRIDLFGRARTVGFYNSWAARCGDGVAEELALHRVEVSRDEGTGEVHGLRGPGFAGVQFHPESVLTLDGPEILAELLAPVPV